MPDRPHDLAVVGGGPVGLVTALHAARAGRSVVVVEPRPAPVDKACGEGIMPVGVAELAALGIRPAGRELRSLTYVGRTGRRVTAALGAPGLGVRRTVLHQALWDAARAAGVAVLPDRVTGLSQDGTGVRLSLSVGASVDATHAIAADGLHSPVRRLLGLDRPPRHRPGARRHGLRRHFAAAPWGDGVEVHWADGGEVYVTPVADDVVGVAVLGSGAGSYGSRLAEVPALVERLRGAEPLDDVRGAGPLRQRSARRVSGRVLLAGDAAGYVDALTGEGLTLGWLQARAAVDAVVAGRPERYERDWWRIGAAQRALTLGLVAATRPTPLRRLVVPAAVAFPPLYRAAVSVVAGR